MDKVTQEGVIHIALCILWFYKQGVFTLTSSWRMVTAWKIKDLLSEIVGSMRTIAILYYTSTFFMTWMYSLFYCVTYSWINNTCIQWRTNSLDHIHVCMYVCSSCRSQKTFHNLYMCSNTRDITYNNMQATNYNGQL